MAGSNKDRRGLGRGLSALMADVNASSPDTSAAIAPITRLPVEKLIRNAAQPRRDFVEADLENLTDSIREKGIIQPLVVRPHPSKGGSYQIVAGERRWRAAQRAQLHDVPVVIRDFTEAEMLEIAIVENIQRADLNAVEEAMAYRDLMQKFGHTQEKLSTALGKSRSHIANLLRLLNLPDDVLELLRSGALSAGHARALIPLNNASAVAKMVVAKGLSVRETERFAKQGDSHDTSKPASSLSKEKDADTRSLEADLSAALGAKVEIFHMAEKGSGTLTIRYKDLGHLDDLCGRLSRY